jgi:hypothetical protein
VAAKPSRDPEGEPSIPDEVWEQFKRDSERDIRTAAPKEPSARARMVTERLRRLDEEAANRQAGGGRKQRKGKQSAPAEPWQPDGWRTGPAWQEMNGRARRRRRVWGVLGVLLAMGLVMVALNPAKALSWLPGAASGEDSTESRAAAVPLPAETVRPTSAPSAEAFSGMPTLDEPFLGSPADRYADGADGIVLPEAEPVGGMSKEQVAFALRKTKEFLVDANLDPRTLRGERPETALGLIEPNQNDVLGPMENALRKPAKDQDPILMFSRFDPQEVRLVGDVVKTRGRMAFKESEQGSVEVYADYTFVYPLVKADPGADEVARTIMRRELRVRVYDPAAYQVTPGKLTVIEYRQEIGNSACFVYDGYLHPQFDSDAAAASASPTGPTIDPYDRSEALDNSTEDCGVVSRS